MTTWGDVFTARQALALVTFARLVKQAHQKVLEETGDAAFAKTVATCLGLAVSNMSPYMSALSIGLKDMMYLRSVFWGSALPMHSDFVEANPLRDYLLGGLDYSLDLIARVIEREGIYVTQSGIVHFGSASVIPLPDQSVPFVVTDPPYYDAVPYADLSDFCYVWLKRMLAELYPDLFRWSLTPKVEECIMDPGPPRPGEPDKTKEFFESTMQKALAECKRVLRPDDLAVVLFAHKGTAGWEAMLNALVQAGWTVTSSWPIETERGARMRAKGSAVLASSVFLACRPRVGREVGDWRDVLAELQPRVHDWMERLVKEDIVGADAIFSCIGPALEIFSRYEKVETAAGKEVTLKEYLEHVWAAVGREALNTIAQKYMAGADPQGFEEDARLTAMWLWTSQTSRIAAEQEQVNVEDEGDEVEEEEETETKKKPQGFVLEYDAARKIAQGLGAHLEELGKPRGIIEIKGKTARLLPVAERRRALFGRETKVSGKKRQGKQLTLFEEEIPEAVELHVEIEAGRTVLDKLHQAMLLVADGNLGALKHFLVDEGVGRDDRFWRLAQALSALYPMGTSEKRWVDSVLSRKRGVGL
jgi:adenine-specific DNA methylase